MEEFIILFLIFAFFIFLISRIIRAVSVSGRMHREDPGEKIVKNILSNLPEEYNVYKNLLLPSSKNGTTEIDHLVVSPYGVFVIETKHYYGTVMGDRDLKEWVQDTGLETKYFPNPLDQNYGHLKAVQEVAHVRFEDMISIVVFAGEAEIPDINSSLKNEYVIEECELLDLIGFFKKRTIKPWFQAKITERLEENNRGGSKAFREHVINVRATH